MADESYIDHRRPSLCTRTGAEFFPLEPRAEDVRIEDIAWATGMKCRYTGHTSTFYSVAEHSVLVAQYVETRWPGCKELVQQALLHDAAETYLPDVTGPVKRDPRIKAWFDPIEEAVERAVAEAFSLSFPMYPEVKIADKELLKREVPQLMPPVSWWTVEAPDEWAEKLTIDGWWPPVATMRFMQAFRRLFL